jgi:hypothetical protein
MKVLREAFVVRLLDTPDVASRLSTILSVPAIFTRRPIPEMARPPYVIVGGPVTDEPWDTKTTVGREILTDIFVYAEETGDESLVEEIAEAAREAIHRKPVAAVGYGVLVQRVSGPLEAPASGLYGRVISVRTQMMRK